MNQDHTERKTAQARSKITEKRGGSGQGWAFSTLQDIRFAVRTLCKAWGFTTTAIVTLALGIGANTAIFQLLDAVRLRTLPVASPTQLAAIEIEGGNRIFGILSSEATLTYPLWEETRLHQQPFSDVFAWTSFGSLTVGEGGYQRRARELWVSGNMFPVLGVATFLGRLFGPDDDRPGCGDPGVVISYAFWKNEFGGRDSAIGRAVVIQDRPTQVIGVTPPGFFGLEIGKHFDFALPLCALPVYSGNSKLYSKRDYFWVRVMGRLKPGETLEQASSQLASMSPGILEATLPSGYNPSALDEYRKFRLSAYPGGSGVSSLRQKYDASLNLLLGTTALVLLIACANLGNLMLVRASAREREMAVRLALGASRLRLIRELLAESLLLAVTGGLIGIGLAAVLSRGLVRFLSTDVDVIQLDLTIDWRVFSFTCIVALLTCVLFGLLPALRSSRADPAFALKSGSRGTTPGRERFSFQRGLIISQIAVSLVLVVGALLFVRSFWKLMSIDPGFREKDIFIASLDLGKLRLSAHDSPPFVRSLLEQVKAIPQVESAATSTHVPLYFSLYPNLFWNLTVRVDAAQGPCRFTWVSPGYLRTMEIPVHAGRDFSDLDTATSRRVAIVNEAFVRKYLSGGPALGKTFRSNAEPKYPEAIYEIVGVIPDTKYLELREPTPPMAFAPADQFPARAQDAFLFVFIRSSAPASGVIAAVREKLKQVNPEMAAEFHIFQADIQNGLVRERLMALLSAFFGAVAVLLATIGLYGVISYILALRRNEIGVRIALGASQQNIIGSTLRQTLYLLVLGIGIGILLALAAGVGAASLLFGLQPSDPLTFIAASSFLVAAALVASFVPAHRASRLDPMIALRYE